MVVARRRGLFPVLSLFLCRSRSTNGAPRDIRSAHELWCKSCSAAFCSASHASNARSQQHRHASTALRHLSSSSSSSSSSSNQNEQVQSLAEQLVSSRFQNVLVLVGAGASVSAGIPDFRSPGTGLYDRLQEFQLPFPEAIFELEYFRSNPKPFTTLCQSIWPGQEGGPKPTLTHSFLKLLEDKNCLRRIYTQNIDGLEALAGISTDKLVECHGHFRSASCISCRTRMYASKCLETVLQGQAPRCQSCGSLVKPDIVFFGEELPMRYQELVDSDIAKCDLLLVIGTSLLVMPVAGIPSWVPKDCPRVLINRDVVGDFAFRPSQRDTILQGDCDDSVRAICKLAGWTDELERIHDKLVKT